MKDESEVSPGDIRESVFSRSGVKYEPMTWAVRVVPQRKMYLGSTKEGYTRGEGENRLRELVAFSISRKREGSKKVFSNHCLIEAVSIFAPGPR